MTMTEPESLARSLACHDAAIMSSADRKHVGAGRLPYALVFLLGRAPDHGINQRLRGRRLAVRPNSSDPL